MFTHRLALQILRYSLGIVFVWFGVLKLFNASPMLMILKLALPPVFANSQLFLFVFSFLEILIGIGLFLKRTVRFTAVVMILSLILITVAVLVTQGFDPRFPILSSAGELVLKNIVFIAAGFVLLTEKKEEVEDKKHEPTSRS